MRIGNIIHVGERALPSYAPVIRVDEPVCASTAEWAEWNDQDGDMQEQVLCLVRTMQGKG